MPKIVVYVGARAARELEAEGFDPAEWVREKVREALTERRGTTVGSASPAGDNPRRSVSANPKGES